MNENRYRHGSPWDRGSADAWYGRPPSPHYYKGDTYQSELVEEKDMLAGEIAEYLAGFGQQVDRKEWE